MIKSGGIRSLLNRQSSGIRYLLASVASLALATSIHAGPIVVNFSANDFTGISLADGTPLPAGDLIEVGMFTAAPTVGNPSLANFVVFGTTVSGSGSSPNGFFAASTVASEGSFGHSNIYIVAFNAATLGAATQEGIWTSSAANWVFPTSNVVNATSIDMEDLVNNPGNNATFKGTTTKVLGGSPIQSADFDGTTYLPLAVVPEPSTWLLAGTGLLALLGFRRRT